jgi:hypothetical protein
MPINRMRQGSREHLIAILETTCPDDHDYENEDPPSSFTKYTLYNIIWGRLIRFKMQIRELKEENRKLKHKMVMLEIKQRALVN